MHKSFTSKQRIFQASRRWRGNWTGPLISFAALLAAIYGVSPNFCFCESSGACPYAGDFLQEWVGGYIVRAGDHGRFYDGEYAQQLEHNERLIGFRWNEERYLPIVYPPFYYAAVCPLSFLPVHVAAWIWAGFMVACLLGTVCLLSWHFQIVFRGAEESPSSENEPSLPNQDASSIPQWVPWLLPASLFFMPLIESFTSSQKGTVCLLILSGTYVLLDRKRPYLAGIVFGLLAFKPQLTLVIAFAMLFKGQWRFVFGGATTGIILGGISLAIGLDVGRQYLAFSTGAADYLRTSGYDLSKSHCLYGFFTLLNGGDATWLVKCATLVSFVGIGALLVVALWRGLQPGTPRFPLQYSLLVIATLLVSPHLFTYDLTILLLPILLLASTRRDSHSASVRSPVNLISILLFFMTGAFPVIARLTGIQVTTILMVALCLVLLWELRRPGPWHSPTNHPTLAR